MKEGRIHRGNILGRLVRAGGGRVTNLGNRDIYQPKF